MSNVSKFEKKIKSVNNGKLKIRRLSGNPVNLEDYYHYNQELAKAVEEATEIYVMKMIPKLIELGAVLPEEKGEEGDINKAIDWTHPQNDELLHTHYYPGLKRVRSEVAEQISTELKKKYPTEIIIPFPGTADSWLKMVAKYGAVTLGSSKNDENELIGVIIDSMKNGF